MRFVDRLFIALMFGALAILVALFLAGLILADDGDCDHDDPPCAVTTTVGAGDHPTTTTIAASMTTTTRPEGACPEDPCHPIGKPKIRHDRKWARLGFVKVIEVKACPLP